MSLETVYWPEVGDRVRVQAPDYNDALYKAGRGLDQGPYYLLDIWDPTSFISKLPVEFQSPTQSNPQAGLPPKAWIGYTVLSYNTQDFKNIDALLELRSKIFWLDLGKRDKLKKPDVALGKVIKCLRRWRCSNCGRRGKEAARPQYCPHSSILCGDAKLLPQIHWIGGDDLPEWFVEEAKSLGVIIYPEVPKFFITDTLGSVANAKLEESP